MIKWGESPIGNYHVYIDFLMQRGVVKQEMPASEITTNALVDDVNRFDPAAIIAQAKAHAP